ncbi:hypothetical protein [Sphingomicrobium flavum]|uniref:hypothetical protein n=1 Tax=Sphingomicrobium flavum TaxID=1229164 RepID=UPI0021AD50D5|nr:hypothetical protein [Sphingomicrobium flavum]
MKVIQNVIGLAMLAWFGFLFFYFSGIAESSPFLESQLGPTIIGLGALCLIIAVPMVIRMIQGGTKFAGEVKPKKNPEDEVPQMSAFEAEDAIERYLKQKAAAGDNAAAASAPTEAPSHGLGAPAPRVAGFGRKGA